MDKQGAYIETVKASDLVLKPISWLWRAYLAHGKLHILGGRPGCGKTTIAMSLAASTTKGVWPDGYVSEIGNVVVWSGEDDPSDTLAPRLILSGADMDKVHFVNAVYDSKGIRAFNPATDTELLERRVKEIGNVMLLVIDPIILAITGDDHKNASVRRGLQPLADLAAAEDVVVLGITHFSKGTTGREPVDRITGSLAYGAAARIVLVASKQRDVETRIFCKAKSNIGEDEGGFEYELVEATLPNNPGITASYVKWGTPIDGAARDILAVAEADDDKAGGRVSRLSEAKDFLLEFLSDGAVEATIVQEAAKIYGIAEKTLQRARESLGIKPTKTGMKEGWVWNLPENINVEDGQEEGQ